jgi:Mitochondrial distribution and morphology protein 10
MINVQHDIGKWCTEYTWSAEDGMLGVRVLHNFGKLGTTSEVLEESLSLKKRVGVKRIDEEDAVEGGLRGRMSIGAEVYFSAKERSAGGLALLLPRSHDLPLLCYNSFSVDWNPFHNVARRNSPVFPSTHAIRCIANSNSVSLSLASGTAFAASNNDYCSLQSNAWAYV